MKETSAAPEGAQGNRKAASSKTGPAFLPIKIKSDRNRIMLIPDPSLPFQDITDYLKGKLGESKHFFHGSRIVLDLQKRPFRAEEIRKLKEILHEIVGADLEEVRLGDGFQGLLNWASRTMGVTVHTEMVPETSSPQAMVISQTCRSGMRIESEAECVILGDVNPGAEVVAEKDIIIMGKLRGTAHAGCRGDRNARIWALGIEPNQLRIADLIAIPPSETHSKEVRMEVAEVRDDRIYVTTL